jgi:hypothetical protein
MWIATLKPSQSPTPMGSVDRNVVWLVDKDFESRERQKLRQRIETLSKEWKKFRNGAQKPSEEFDESEGEIEFIDAM